eukprot:12880439-Prorocentrum_lima.AAC.1
MVSEGTHMLTSLVGHNPTATAAAPAAVDNDKTKSWKMPIAKLEVTEARQKCNESTKWAQSTSQKYHIGRLQ